jgi:hypothetical protein
MNSSLTALLTMMLTVVPRLFSQARIATLVVSTLSLHFLQS